VLPSATIFSSLLRTRKRVRRPTLRNKSNDRLIRPANPIALTLTQGAAAPQARTLDANTPALNYASGENTPLVIANGSNAPVIALVETSFEPSEPGAKAPARAQGFALTTTLWRVNPGDAPPSRLEAVGQRRHRAETRRCHRGDGGIGQSAGSHHVAISLPLPAGFEPLNPNIATASREARPSTAPTLAPSWTSYGDDLVFHAYDTLPKGNYASPSAPRRRQSGRLRSPPASSRPCIKRAFRAPAPACASRSPNETAPRARFRRRPLRGDCGGVWLAREAFARAELVAPRATEIVYDREGVFLTQIAHGESAGYGYWPLEKIPERFVAATLALEDRRFYSHGGGRSFLAIARAAWNNIARRGRREGASTIAMQVARMQNPGPRGLNARSSRRRRRSR